MNPAMQNLTITLPDHKVEYLENMSEYIAETASEIIEELVYNHFIRHFEIIDGMHQQNIKGKPFADHIAEHKFLEHQLKAWPKDSVEYQMLQSRLNALGDRPYPPTLNLLSL
jgi:hypothetical protein